MTYKVCLTCKHRSTWVGGKRFCTGYFSKYCKCFVEPGFTCDKWESEDKQDKEERSNEQPD